MSLEGQRIYSIGVIPKHLKDAVSTKRIKIQKYLLNYAKYNIRYFPWRNDDWGPFKIFVCEILLKRTHAKTVANFIPGFFKKFNKLDSIAHYNEKELSKVLEPIGLQHQRANFLIVVANYLIENHRGSVPDNYESLIKIPGIGDYIAKAVLSFAYNQPMAVVDSNITRVYLRVFKYNITVINQKYFQWIADCLLPTINHKIFNYILIDLGATICHYSHPKCNICPLNGLCDYNKPLKQSLI
jgi:A/G-specific adenine glycosylase